MMWVIIDNNANISSGVAEISDDTTSNDCFTISGPEICDEGIDNDGDN